MPIDGPSALPSLLGCCAFPFLFVVTAGAEEDHKTLMSSLSSGKPTKQNEALNKIKSLPNDGKAKITANLYDSAPHGQSRRAGLRFLFEKANASYCSADILRTLEISAFVRGQKAGL